MQGRSKKRKTRCTRAVLFSKIVTRKVWRTWEGLRPSAGRLREVLGVWPVKSPTYRLTHRSSRILVWKRSARQAG
jgi:hypothetical protein